MLQKRIKLLNVLQERSRAFKAQMIAKLKRELKQAERDKAVMDVKIGE